MERALMLLLDTNILIDSGTASRSPTRSSWRRLGAATSPSPPAMPPRAPGVHTHEEWKGMAQPLA
jgi:hypothetical protein